MPTLWKWDFAGMASLADRNGEQRAFAGDKVFVVDPDYGTCELDLRSGRR